MYNLPLKFILSLYDFCMYIRFMKRKINRQELTGFQLFNQLFITSLNRLRNQTILF